MAVRFETWRCAARSDNGGRDRGLSVVWLLDASVPVSLGQAHVGGADGGRVRGAFTGRNPQHWRVSVIAAESHIAQIEFAPAVESKVGCPSSCQLVKNPRFKSVDAKQLSRLAPGSEASLARAVSHTQNERLLHQSIVGLRIKRRWVNGSLVSHAVQNP